SRDVEAASERIAAGRGPLHVRLAVGEGARDGDDMRRLGGNLGKAGAGGIADITVALRLQPGVAFGFLEDTDAIAEEELGVLTGIRPRRVADVQDGYRHLHQAALDEAVCLHFALEARVGKVGPKSVQSSVESG